MDGACPSPGDVVAVAMSGGVDSSTAAAFMLEAGCRVVGLTMLLSGDEAGTTTVGRARVVAGFLGIEHHVVDCRDPFLDRVLRPVWTEYARGRTPNPCVLCNPGLKFGLLLEHARSIGARFLATGHHARLQQRSGGTDAPVLLRGRDPAKDQSYFLARLAPEQRRAAVFPIGRMTKAEVRQAARERRLPSAEAPESQDTCVVVRGDLDLREGVFAETVRLRMNEEARPGRIVEVGTGRVVGRHRGVHLFTVGQRRGLGVSLGRRAHVVAIDGAYGDVWVSADPHDLLAGGLVATGVVWSGEAAPPGEGNPFACEVQIRYRHRPVAAQVAPVGPDGADVRFQDAVSAVTPGQAAVFFRHDEVLGCGWIDRAAPLRVTGS